MAAARHGLLRCYLGVGRAVVGPPGSLPCAGATRGSKRVKIKGSRTQKMFVGIAQPHGEERDSYIMHLTGRLNPLRTAHGVARAHDDKDKVNSRWSTADGRCVFAHSQGIR